jgi:hypothetical protein
VAKEQEVRQRWEEEEEEAAVGAAAAGGGSSDEGRGGGDGDESLFVGDQLRVAVVEAQGPFWNPGS